MVIAPTFPFPTPDNISLKPSLDEVSASNWPRSQPITSIVSFLLYVHIIQNVVVFDKLGINKQYLRIHQDCF